MLTVLYMYLFVLGLIFGSFFNVVGLRIPENQSIVKPRSACPSCHHTLTAIELIPVFSYILQKGKCRNCKKTISPLYPFVEMTTAILFTISPLWVGWSKELIIALTFISLFMIIFVSDIVYMIIPDKVLIFFAVLIGIERVFIPLTPWWDVIIGAIVGFSLLFFITLISKGGMGGGDVKLFFVIGLVLGWKLTILAFFLSTLYGTFFGIVGMLMGKVKKGKPFPFGPFIVLGSLTAYYFGESLLTWYIEFIVT